MSEKNNKKEQSSRPAYHWDEKLKKAADQVGEIFRRENQQMNGKYVRETPE
jgi:hypothetical protein